MSHYSRLESNTGVNIPVYKDIELSSTTVSRRNQIKSLMDDFCSFKWCGIDAFETFGAFIINSRNLKFYNGPSFSNQYTKPQFESATGTLTGVTFNTQQISFTVAVYWISEDHYRRLIYWLHPYEINTLSFGFEPDYYYQVKLSKIGDSTRTIAGYEGKEPMYYTELSLTFEVQGPNCAYAAQPYEFTAERGDAEHKNELTWTFSAQQDAPSKSDLAMPFKWYIHLDPSKVTSDISTWKDVNVNLRGTAIYGDSSLSGTNVQLFEADLQNLVFSGNYSADFNIVYDSETSLMFLNHGDSENFLLSHLLTSSTGKRIVNSLSSQQYTIPGRFEDYTIDPQKNWKLKLEVYITSNDTSIAVQPNNLIVFENGASYVEMRARTNLI